MEKECTYRKAFGKGKELCTFVNKHNARVFYKGLCVDNKLCPKGVVPLCPVCGAIGFENFKPERKMFSHELDYCTCKNCHVMFKVLPVKDNNRGQINKFYIKVEL